MLVVTCNFQCIVNFSNTFFFCWLGNVIVRSSLSLQVGTKQWRYYDFGPKAVPPLICLPGTAGTADVHYKQIMALSMKVVI